VTVPVGVPAPEVTVAVNVTDWPTTDGFWLDVRPVVVAAPITTWSAVLDVLAAKPVAPPAAATVGGPATRDAEGRRVGAERITVTVETELPSMVKVTEPLGVPAAEVTVAVNVTDWPTTDGFWLDVRLVVVAAPLTTWLTVLDVLVANPVAPP